MPDFYKIKSRAFVILRHETFNSVSQHNTWRCHAYCWLKQGTEGMASTGSLLMQYGGDRHIIENYLKELKIGVGMEQMPCREFDANAMYFSIGALTYNLMLSQKHFAKECMCK